MAQTERLCGGAAVAMVLRYWGARDVFPQDFEPLVERGGGGIRTSALVSAVSDRGWQAHVPPVVPSAGVEDLRAEVNRGRPMIALLEDSPGRWHYVVVVAGTDEHVVVHDPARAPFRVLTRADFERAWAASDRWTLRILPNTNAEPASNAPPVAGEALDSASTSSSASPCDALVADGVTRARAGDPDAERSLVSATRLCPALASAWRELAGLRFKESRWSDASVHALQAVTLAPDDRYSWQLLGSARFLEGNAAGALAAWNAIGEPRADVITITGLDHTPQSVVAERIGIEPRQLLTPGLVERATARLRELPTASDASIRIEPMRDGAAHVRAAIDERDVYPRGMMDLAAIGVRGAMGEIVGEFTNLVGAGESWRGAWRWTRGRPRLTFEMAVPAPGWLPGVAALKATVLERYTYRTGLDASSPTVTESRKRAGIEFSDWATDWLRWQFGGAMDRFDSRNFLAVDGGLDLRAGEHVLVRAGGGLWSDRAAVRFTTARVSTSWQNNDDATRPILMAIGGAEIASEDAPLALWQRAGARSGREARLRGHSIYNGGVLTSEVFGRRIAFGSLEYEHPVRLTKAGQVGVAVFADTARAWRRLVDTSPSPWHVDLGVGLRLHPKAKGPAVGIDFGWGLRDGGFAMSANWSARR
jgi:predicted double-glycine peptidase